MYRISYSVVTYVLLLILIKVDWSTSNAVYFQPATEFRFDYEGTSEIKDLGTFSANAKIGVINLDQWNGTQHCLLRIHFYHIRVLARDSEKEENVHMDDIDFTKWLSFDMDANGYIEGVYYDSKDEHSYAVELKKKILNLLSNKLMISEIAEEENSRWAYNAEEQGHEGHDSVVYQAEPDKGSNKIVFKRQKRSSNPLPSIDQNYNKEIHLDRKRNIPHHSKIEEDFVTLEKPRNTIPRRQATEDDENTNDKYVFPVMQGKAQVSLTFDREVVSEETSSLLQDRPQQLIADTLQHRKIPDKMYNESVGHVYVAGNVTCMMQSNTSEGQETKMMCFREVYNVLARLNHEDLRSVVLEYKSKSSEEWSYIIDALGAAQTNATLELLTELVFATRQKESINITMAALAQIIRLNNCPPKILRNTLFARVMDIPWTYDDEHQTQLVNERAILVLGSVARATRGCNRTWSDLITNQMREKAGIHDPYEHRAKRKALSHRDFNHHVANKVVYLMALSNDGHPDSFDIFKTYVNDTESHIQLRCSGVRAIGRYDHSEAANVLLHVGINDPDKTVRHNALDAYTIHPFGGDIRNFIRSEEYRYTNLTDTDHVRMRRSLLDVASKIWKGYQFRLETPSFLWLKTAGGPMLGASMGVIIDNFLNIDIGPLSGVADLNIHDKAWVTAHLGLIGMDFDIFVAEVCYKGSIGYDLNILGELDLEQTVDDALQIERLINSVVRKIRTSIDNFKSLLNTIRGFDIEEIFEDFIDAIKQMPQQVFDLRKIARRMSQVLEEYTALPPVFYQIKDFVRKVTNMFTDVKHDVMGLYNAIVDTVETTLPWAWREIKSAFNGMVQALRNILRNPMTSILNLGRGVARISLAVGVVLDAKDRIVEANIFARDNRPYWFDFDAVFNDLWDDISEITRSFGDTVNWLRGENGTDTEMAMTYAGVSLNDMKEQVLQELWSYVLEELLEPFNHLRRLLDPFILTYQYVTETIQNVKDAWANLVEAYNIARTLIESIFGSKFHENFPRKFLLSGVCGDGFWESTGRGEYEHPGIDLVVAVYEPIVAPFNGKIRKTGPTQMTIDIEDMTNIEIIIDNVFLPIDRTNEVVGAGDVIGLATNTWCATGHIHVAMRDVQTNRYIDPSRFKRRRRIPHLQWIWECNTHELVYLDLTLQIGAVAGDPTEIAINIVVSNAPDPSDFETEGFTSSPPSRSLSDWINRFADFTQSLGLGLLSDVTDVFTLRLNDIRLGTLLDFVREQGEFELERTINAVIVSLEAIGNQESCVRPESMSEHELQLALLRRALSTRGSRGERERRLRNPPSECFGLTNHITNSSFCTFDNDCMGLSCCVDFSLFGIFRHAVVSYIRYDPCEQMITLGIDSWFVAIDVPNINEFREISDASLLDLDTGNLNVIQLTAHYEITLEDSLFKVSLTLALCSSLAEECTDLLVIANELELPHAPCTDATLEGTPVTTTSVSTELTMGSFIDQLDVAGLSEDEIVEIIDRLRDAFVSWVEQQIDEVITEVFDNILDSSDVCMTGFPLSYGPFNTEIYRQIPPIIIPLGWFLLIFEFGLNGYYGARFHCTFCGSSMQAGATVTPFVGAVAWGSIALALGPFQIRLRLDGYLLTTEFPTQIDVDFSKFPIEVKTAMDMKLTPLRVTLFGEIVFEISFKIWSARITIRIVIIRIKLWEYRTRTIHKRIFGNDEIEPDLSPPEFLPFEQDFGSGLEFDDERSKRDVSPTAACTVYQIAGKDYTEPAFNVQFDVADDRSDPDISLCVGTYRRGCDVLNNEPLGGRASLQSRALYSGVPLHFTIKATNSQGTAAHLMCDIPTYDVTPPTGRVTPEFKSTSHPNILRCSMFVTDDSEMLIQQISAGYGVTRYGSQLVPWLAFDTDEQTIAQTAIRSINDYLTYFAVPKTGRLVYPAFVRRIFAYAARCAQECLSHLPSKCLGFNFDYGPSGTCELLNAVEGHATVELSGSYHYFERLGVGSTSHIDRDDLSLIHDSTLYCNVYLQNVLGYENFMRADAIHIDFTPPDPGPYIDIESDTLLVETCDEYTPSHFDLRCIEQTPLPNYRFITDVPFSDCTVCNGHTAGEELFWTRANRMVSCNWDYIHDNETGILIYTWAVGTEPCEDNIHPHRDPHAHIHKESEWTHQGVAFPLDLEDGIYHITLTALNEVEFGGPMALRICHQTPYIIDTTPPVIHHIDQALYDEDTLMITMIVTTEDDLSEIRYQQLGLGRSRHDTYILHFITVHPLSPLELRHRIPDGVPTWVKVRAANNVDLRTVGHSPRAIFVDSTPPLAGTLYMGFRIGVHEDYQYQSSVLCVNWQDFYDPDSGISTFQLAFGTAPGAYDMMEFRDIEHTEYSYCQGNLALQQNTQYFATLTAINGATIARNVTATSNPITVDETAPHVGAVKDGSPGINDVQYSSSPSTVAVTWQDIFDTESGITRLKVSFVKRGRSEDFVLHAEVGLPNSITTLEFHHFHLQHGDRMYIEVNATNGAKLSAENESDGFVIDLTDPEMNYLVDGLQINDDIQYSPSTTALSANWMYSDAESGITSYKVALFTLASGLRQQIYPNGDDQWIILPPGTTDWQSEEVLSLQPGHFYFVRVMATNGASLTSVYDTDGVVIDPTPPQMSYVHVGVLAGDSEEVVDGYVFQNDPYGIRASWIAHDSESGVLSYLVGIGTSPGNDDIRPFEETTEEDGYLDGITLELTDRNLADPAPLYYITVKAKNGATQYSDPIVSTPIILVEEDQDGLVWDGTGEHMDADIDYQLEEDELSMAFEGFESALHGIERYEWAVGSQPRYDDVMPFTSYGIIITDDRPLGLGSNGYASIIIPLQHGEKYYVTVRATTGAGNVMDVCSDGVVIDHTPPMATMTRLDNQNDVVDQERVYQADSIMEAEWTSTDEEGFVSQTYVSVGTIPDNGNYSWLIYVIEAILSFRNGEALPEASIYIYDGGEDVYTSTITECNELLPGSANPVLDGKPNFVTVTIQNQNGLTASVSSAPIIIDTTPPTEGIVDCPVFATGNVIKCYLWDFSDLESGLARFDVALGLTEGDTSVHEFMEISAGSHYFSITFESLENYGENQRYFVTVVAINNAMLRTRVFSQAVFVDNTPPIGNTVVELLDHESFDVSASLHTYPGSTGDSMSDAVCQRDITRVHIAWDTFIDEETGIDHYDVALGTAPEGTQIVGYTRLDHSQDSHVFNGLNLAHIPTVYATVRGYNRAGLHTTITSNGVHISRLSAGLSPLHPLLVYDGTGEIDLDFQNHVDSLGSTWRLTGDPCPFNLKQWSVHRFDNVDISGTETIPEGQEYASLDEILIQDRESFYVKITARNHLNHTIHLHSDGVTIKLEPVLPGAVRDGIIRGVDLSYQVSNDTIGCHWDGFGRSRSDGTFNNIVEGDDPASDIEVGEHQSIAHYEVAIGTDRTTHGSRTDIRPFTDVGTNSSWLFHNLNLEMETSIYYCTVRAYSISTASTEVTSNGIRVGHGGRLITHGHINVERFISSTTSLMISWGGFEFSKPILRYYWGLSSGHITESELDSCNDMVLTWQTHGATNALPFQDAALDTFVSPTALSLVHGEEYSVIVVAVDESGTCDAAVKIFTVDVTPPHEGTLRLRNSVDMAVLYTDELSAIHAVWHGFHDAESGIKTISIELHSSVSCNPDPNEDGSLYLLSADALPGNGTNYTFSDLTLEYDSPYYISLQLENAAGLSLTVLSKPILVDIEGPAAGVVVDGLNLHHDMTFQSSTTDVSGSFLYRPLNADACSQIVYNEFSDHGDFTEIVHKGLWRFEDGRQRNTHFWSSQVEFSDTSLKLNIERKLTQPAMKSGAVRIDIGDIYPGVYKFEMATADQTWAATAITFWDGPQGILVAPTNSSSDSTGSPSSGIRILNEALNGDTFDEGYTQSSVHGNGFGVYFKIAESEDAIRTEAVLWGKSWNEYRETTVTLPFDASADTHTYDVAINEGRDVTDMRDWDIKLYVDQHIEGLLGGIHGVFSNASIFLGVFNENGFVPDVVDRFNPPSGSTTITSIVLPSPDDITCQPFKGGDHPIVEFYAGIGTEAGLHDIVPLQLISSPPIPCGRACDELYCNVGTDDGGVQDIHFTLSGLDLEPSSDDMIGDDVTAHLQQAYFLTVKAFTGSGKSASSSSNGFYIDTTPPTINSILHFDAAYSSQEPINVQGNDHTIHVIFNTEDETSGISENRWAIGTIPHATDIQNYTSLGTEQFAINTELQGLLHNHHVYFVTIMSINDAGLITYNSSEGVTVLLDVPDVSATPVDMPGTTGIGSEDTNAVQSTSQSNFTIAIGTPPEDQGIVDIQVSAETAEGDNIFPPQQVGYNSSNQVSLTGEGVRVGDEDYEPLNASRGRNEMLHENTEHNRRKRSAENLQLFIDPGRLLHFVARGCNRAHNCGEIPTRDIAVVRETDSVTEVGESGAISVDIETEISGTGSIRTATTSNQISDTYLISGSLSRADMQNTYFSDAGLSYNPMIVNPESAPDNTDRALLGRIRSVSDCGFYLSVLPAKPIHGSIQMDFQFDSSEYVTQDGTTEPRILAYCSTERIWVDAAESCVVGGGSFVNWLDSTVTVFICNLPAYCRMAAEGRTRFRRQADDDSDDFTGSHSFVLASTDTEYINYAPVLWSDTSYEIMEDPGIVEISLIGRDPENDTFEFLLSENSTHMGLATLSSDGTFTYRPCDDCFGQDNITIILQEIREDEIEPQESQSVLNINISPVNDNPRLIVMQDGDCLSDDVYRVTLVTEEFAPDKDDYIPLEIILGAYDVDGNGVNIYYGTVENGEVVIQNQMETNEYIEQNCSLSWDDRREQWTSFEHDLRENAPRFVMVLPCNMSEDVTGKTLQWTLSLVKYIPEIGFYGTDTLLVNSNDNSMSRLPSELMYITIYTLANPCLNSAICVGPETDPECTSLNRSSGFEGYRCQCRKGFKGEHCETNVDDCDPNKCDAGYKCIDKVAGYECECVSGSCAIPSWGKALIVITVIAIVSIVIVIFACVCLLKRKRGSEEERLLRRPKAYEVDVANDNEGYDTTLEEFCSSSAPPSSTSMPAGIFNKHVHGHNHAKDVDDESQPFQRGIGLEGNGSERTVSETATSKALPHKHGLPKQPQGFNRIPVKSIDPVIASPGKQDIDAGHKYSAEKKTPLASMFVPQPGTSNAPPAFHLKQLQDLFERTRRERLSKEQGNDVGNPKKDIEKELHKLETQYEHDLRVQGKRSETEVTHMLDSYRRQRHDFIQHMHGERDRSDQKLQAKLEAKKREMNAPHKRKDDPMALDERPSNARGHTKKNQRPKTGGQSTKKKYVSHTPRPKTSEGIRDAWDTAEAGKEQEETAFFPDPKSGWKGTQVLKLENKDDEQLTASGSHKEIVIDHGNEDSDHEDESKDARPTTPRLEYMTLRALYHDTDV